jgi:protein involved in polysaccharide export with SLBB domain
MQSNAEQMTLLSDIRAPQQSSEFIFRSSPQESLISVQLLGAVNKPGIYYIPSNTDMLKLLTLAGGSSSNGDITELIVRKKETGSWARINSISVKENKGAFQVNLEKLIEHGGANHLILNQDDFIYVPQRSSFLNSDAIRGATFVSVIMGIVLSGFVIQKYAEQK